MQLTREFISDSFVYFRIYSSYNSCLVSSDPISTSISDRMDYARTVIYFPIYPFPSRIRYWITEKLLKIERKATLFYEQRIGSTRQEHETREGGKSVPYSYEIDLFFSSTLMLEHKIGHQWRHGKHEMKTRNSLAKPGQEFKNLFLPFLRPTD